MAESKEIPHPHVANDAVMAGSPTYIKHKFLVPSPITTRKTRTSSVSEAAMQGPTYKGRVESFCRQKGHGFILPEDGTEHIFVHISDIDEEYAIKEGDTVFYKKVSIPPKKEKYQAMHVRFCELAAGAHEKWDSPASSPSASPRADLS